MQSSYIPAAEERNDNMRTLHRIVPLKNWPRLAKPSEPITKIAVLDTETEGFDPRSDRILEFSATMIEVDARGRIVSAMEPGTAFNDPQRPIDERIRALTGITDEMVSGQNVSVKKVTTFLKQADAVLAFNAAFDRPHLEMLLPGIESLKWICAMADVPWQALGFDGVKQGYLLMQAGMFNPVAHRARDDVESLVNLLACEARDGRTIMSHALESARQPSWRLEATNAPYRFSEELKRAGYRYSFRKVRHKLVRPRDRDFELAWYRETIDDEPSIVPVDWTQRYRADWTWTPVKRKLGPPGVTSILDLVSQSKPLTVEDLPF